MKFRLKSAHYFPEDKLLMGDVENASLGDDKGTLVGDGTPHAMTRLSEPKPGAMTPTIEMVPLDEEAEEALQEEIDRLTANQASMNPIEQLAVQMAAAQSMDTFEHRYVPGFEVKRQELKGARK